VAILHSLRFPQIARNVGITWIQIPLAMVLCEPFVVGLMYNLMEVRNSSPTARQCVIQMFNDIDRINVASQFLAQEGSIFMASRERRTVCRLNPVPLQQQIETLIGVKEFLVVLQVVDLLDVADRTAKDMTLVFHTESISLLIWMPSLDNAKHLDLHFSRHF